MKATVGKGERTTFRKRSQTPSLMHRTATQFTQNLFSPRLMALASLTAWGPGLCHCSLNLNLGFLTTMTAAGVSPGSELAKKPREAEMPSGKTENPRSQGTN